MALLIFSSVAIAQNVGINTPSPTSSLDINGGLRLRPTVTIVSGASVMLASNRAHHVLNGTPTGDFNIAFIGATEDGQHVIITNNTMFKGFLVPIYIQPYTTVELIYSGVAWKQIGSNEAVSKTAWSLTGNAGTDTSANFIGTRDDKPLLFKINNQKAGLISGSNLALGALSLNKLEQGGNNFNNHTAIGNSALSNLINGFLNVGLGTGALNLLKNGSGNIGIGFQSGAFALGSNNVVIANQGGYVLNETDSVTDNVIIGNHTPTLNLISDKNVLIGSNAGGFVINGGSNVAVGDSSSASNTTGKSNVAIGAKALALNTTKSNLVAIGDSALYNNGTGAVLSYLGTGNTAVGSKSLFGNTIGSSNTALGTNALIQNTTGSSNTAIGHATLTKNITGNFNTAVGNQAMQGITSGTAESNVAVGLASLFWIKNGNKNNALGFSSLQNNTDGSNNVAIGDSSLFKNVTGYSNVAIGAKALALNSNKNNLVAVGDSALFNNGIGANSSQANFNTAVGSKALYKNEIGSFNTALGTGSLNNRISGDENTAIGTSALASGSSGNSNTGIGRAALLNTNGSLNTGLGLLAMWQHQTGTENLALGPNSLSNNISGTGNVALGANAAFNELGSNKLYIENSGANKDNALIYGDFAADSLNLNAKVNIRDFTRLGTQASGAPAIKMVELSGITSAVNNGSQAISLLGVDATKVLSVSVLVGIASNAVWIPPAYDNDPRLKYNYFVHTNGNIYIQNSSSNCVLAGDHICSKPLKILITYKE